MKQHLEDRSPRQLGQGRRDRRRGFTLMELMIVVAVVAILAAIAYPSFIEQIRKSRRADAQTSLMELTAFMERAYTNCDAYNVAPPACTALTLPFDQSPRDGGTKHYDIAVEADATTYTLTASPTATDACGAMAITNVGVKTASKADGWK